MIRSFIHSSLDIIYGFHLDASKNKLWYTHIQLCLPVLYKSGMISIIYHNYGESFIEIIPLPVFYAMRTPWNKFLI